MLKGCTKKVIFVKLTDNFMYEEAYFVVRPGVTSVCAEGDLLSEAKRIISGGCAQKADKKGGGRAKKRVMGAVCFIGGAAFTGAVLMVFKLFGMG